MALTWRLWDPREPEAENAGALVSHQLWTSRTARPGKVLQLTFSWDIPVPHSRAGTRSLFSLLASAGSSFFGRQVAAFLPIVAVHLLAFYIVANDELRLSRALTPLVVRFVPFERAAKPPDPPMLPAGALDVDYTLMSVIPPQLEFDAFDTFTTPAPSKVQAPVTPGPIEEIVEKGEEGPFIRPRPVRGPTGIDRYPSGSIAAKEAGRATITICITAAGRVETVAIAKSTGFERLDNAALDIARKYEFRPAMRSGKPIPVCLPYSINYKLK